MYVVIGTLHLQSVGTNNKYTKHVYTNRDTHKENHNKKCNINDSTKYEIKNITETLNGLHISWSKIVICKFRYRRLLLL
jgi:hypothetical protein